MSRHAPNQHKTAYDKRNLLQLPKAIQEHINQGAIVYTSHSAGKDSQAMYNYLTTLVPHPQIVLVYADLGNIVWEGTKDHINNTASHPLHTVRANKTLFDMVRHRAKTRPDVPSWPSHAYRQCTSDLKVDPIYKFIRHNMKSRNARLAINAVGLRAEESTGRAKKNPWALNKTLSKAGRTVYDWFPIFNWTEDDVFNYIRACGQRPFWIYATGNKRNSCVFCILACNNDLTNGYRHRPELYREYNQLENETGWTMFPDKSLKHRITRNRVEPTV